MHTVLGWVVWVALCLAAVAVAFILAISVPIFSYLIGNSAIFPPKRSVDERILSGIAASLFASWYTYGIAGFFWLHDTYHLKGGWQGIRRHLGQCALALFTILVGAFICVAGTYVSIKASAVLNTRLD